MPNESSAVSNLISQTHGPRLGTDPADLVLFDCTNRAQPARPKVPALRPALRPRLLDSVLPELATEPPLDRFERPAPETSEEPEERSRVWPFVVATIFVAALGVLVPAYLTGAFDSEVPAVTSTVTPPPAPARAIAAPVVTPAEPTPAPGISKADPAAGHISGAPVVAEPAPVAEPPVAAPAETPAVTPAEPPHVAPPARPKSKRVAVKRAKPAIAKPAAAKPAAAKLVAAKPAAAKPVAPPVVEPEPPKPSPPKRQQQAADNENPL